MRRPPRPFAASNAVAAPAALPVHKLTALAALAALGVLAASPRLALAAPGVDSPYRTDAQSSHVEDATSRGVNQVNMITCIMSALRPDALVNQGNYIALVDKNKCDTEGRSSSSNSGSNSGATSAPSYMNATVNSTRASDAVPMRGRTWINEVEEGFEATVFVNISATEAPSASNPYGVFRLDYCAKPNTSGAPCMSQGYLEGATTGISYFERESDGGTPHNKALQLTTIDSTSGAGSLEMEEQGQPVAFTFAYNADYFRRSDGTTDQCFSRDASDPQTAMSVWRYGLYDASSGERVSRNSGFPIEVTAGGHTYNGYMGYWGMSLPPEAANAVSTGSTVTKVEYVNGQEPQRTDYSLVKIGGRLMKYTKRTRTLAAIDKIKFNTFIFNTSGFVSGAQANQQYEMYWDNTAGDFKVTGYIDCSQMCQTRDLPGGEQSVAASYFASMGGARGYSQALGGELFINLAGVSGTPQADSIDVIYRVQDLVYPTELPPHLYCLRDCPTAASLSGYFAPQSSAQSPFTAASFNRWNPANLAEMVSYTTDPTDPMLRDEAQGAVSFTDASAMQEHPQFQWGVRTGRLFTTPSSALCAQSQNTYCEQQIEQLDVYYQWETGSSQWNQFAAVKDGSGNFVPFDAPLQVNYTVPSGVQYGQYANKEIVLQYGGFGDLGGIPGHCVSRVTNQNVSCDTQDSRYVPAFVIPFDETLGVVMNNSSPLLAKWLDREIRFARKPLSVCTNAGVTLPTGLTLPTVASLADPSDSASSIYIGEQPSVTAAPRVIHGEVKY